MGYEDSVYEPNRVAAAFYEMWIGLMLLDVGIALTPCLTREEQYAVGENREGVEIKLDRRMASTGNLYIEVAEKAHPDRAEYSPSGIHRGDNTRVFLIGDYDRWWAFHLDTFRKMDMRGRLPRVRMPTSIGFLLPVSWADEYCACRWTRAGGFSGRFPCLTG